MCFFSINNNYSAIDRYQIRQQKIKKFFFSIIDSIQLCLAEYREEYIKAEIHVDPSSRPKNRNTHTHTYSTTKKEIT